MVRQIVDLSAVYRYKCLINIMFISKVLEGYGQSECGAICCLQIKYVCNVNIVFIPQVIEGYGQTRVWSYLLSIDTECL